MDFLFNNSSSESEMDEESRMQEQSRSAVAHESSERKRGAEDTPEDQIEGTAGHSAKAQRLDAHRQRPHRHHRHHCSTCPRSPATTTSSRSGYDYLYRSDR